VRADAVGRRDATTAVACTSRVEEKAIRVGSADSGDQQHARSRLDDGAGGLFAVGTMGTVVHYDGEQWSVECVEPGDSVVRR